SVAPDLSIAENVFLGSQPTNRFGLVQWRRMAREAGEQLARFGIDVDPLSRLGDLPIGLQQLIEIARVLFSGARIIILDEPTFASTAQARRAGIAFVSESRRDMLFHQEPVYKNISVSILDRISRLLLKPSRERSIARRQVEQLQIRPAAVELNLGMLSGGNQ